MPEGDARALDSLNLEIGPGEIVGLVGESGSGKTVTALSLLGLIQPPGEVRADELTFDGIDLRSLSEDGWADVRGSRIALIFQDPKIRLNPVFSIGTQVAEVIELHQGLDRHSAWEHMLTLLEEVEIPEAERKAYVYPHELSIGQAQRVMIAMALAIEPDLISNGSNGRTYHRAVCRACSGSSIIATLVFQAVPPLHTRFDRCDPPASAIR
jgi:ABC-type dipeptide/oligopeptide/nickel transport system ATPase component